MVAQQHGAKKIAGFKIFDRPDKLIDLDAAGKLAKSVAP